MWNQVALGQVETNTDENGDSFSGDYVSRAEEKNEAELGKPQLVSIVAGSVH